jgi:hypothetical protein
MIAVPPDMPPTTPVPPTLATAVFDEDHEPPVAVLERVVLAPWQTVGVPVMMPAVSAGNMVTSMVSLAVPQLLVTVYDITAVPAVTPVTMPLVLTDALAALLLLHVPPVAVLPRAVVKPMQVVGIPVMVPALGNGLTVIV